MPTLQQRREKFYFLLPLLIRSKRINLWRDTWISHLPKAITFTERSGYNKSFLLSKCEICLRLHISENKKIKPLNYQRGITDLAQQHLTLDTWHFRKISLINHTSPTSVAKSMYNSLYSLIKTRHTAVVRSHTQFIDIEGPSQVFHWDVRYNFIDTLWNQVLIPKQKEKS